MPVFYYQDGRVAVASNSVVRLVEHLRAAGVQLRPNPAEVAARGTDFFALHQLATFETAVAGVKILPVGYALRIESGDCRVERLPRTASSDYRDDLKTFIATWVDRIATLLASDRLHLAVDLSGGIDSRMVFALFHNVMRDAPREWMKRVAIYSHGFLSPLDPEIAEQVLSVSEAALTQSRRWQRSFSVFPNSGQSERPMQNPLRVWWARCGGLYSPNYLTSVHPDPGLVLFGGGGGEGFRDFYSKFFPTPAVFAGSCRRRINLPEHNEWLRDQVLEAFASLAHTYGEDANPMIMHYREFRGRLHGGLRSRSRISLMPIASGLLEMATRSLAAEALDQGQIFHDVIGNCAPALVGVRFDQDKKAPTPEISARFVDCGADAIKIQPGIVHGTPVTTPSNAVKVDGLRQLADAVKAAGKLPYVREIWDAETIQKAVDMSAQAASKGRFTHPNPASLVAGILTAGMFD